MFHEELTWSLPFFPVGIALPSGAHSHTATGPRPARDRPTAEDASQVQRHRTPTVMTAQRDPAHATFHRVGWANTASARRAHGQPEAVLTLHGIP